MPVLATLRRALHTGGTFVLDALAPLRCVGCNRLGTIACPDCLAKVQTTVTTTPGPEPLTSISSAVEYQDQFAQRLLHALKYDHIRGAVEPLAHWLIPVVRAVHQPGDVLIPVPLHARRRRQRGFNQSELLAKKVSAAVNVPIAYCVQRNRNTKPQVECDGEERRKNLVDAFTVSPFNTKRIIVLDDVTTTGSTFVEIAKAIRKVSDVPIIGVAVGRG
ncbi:MAG: hypothetical protein AAB445_02820 [Patescibacteria group bacterium]